MAKKKLYFLSLIFFLSALLIIGLFFTCQANFLRNLGGIFFKKQETKIIYKPEYTITILEGWTNQDIAQYFEDKAKWSKGEVLDYIDSASTTAFYQNKFDFLDKNQKIKSLEGYLFPDTYRVFASSTISEVVDKMLGNFDKKLTPEMRSDIIKQGKTISDIVIMASIIEKEAPFYAGHDNSDAKIVSGIFWNRIKNGQALQSDATLSYIFRDNKPSHKGVELENSSPYNTYKYRELPPGPISNPGILAIEAAIYPSKTDYNYFLTDSKGYIYYAKNYSEHQQNISKYLK